MNVNIIPNTFNQDKYDRVAIHPMQSWAWGEARKKMGIEVLRIGEFSKDQLETVYQITFHKIPYTNFKIGYLPRSVFPSKNALEFITDYCKKNNIIFVKIEPYVFKKQFNNRTIEQFSNLAISSHPLFPSWSQILNLHLSEEELLKKMHPKTRYNIRLAQKKGIIIKEMNNEKGFEIFSKLYFETCKRQKYFGHTKKYHQLIWESLKNNISHILIAFYNDIPLAAYELFNFNKVFYYTYGGSSEQYRNLMPANLLMWETIKSGKKLGAEYLDMWGSLPPKYNDKDPWSGFTRFKQGYGTEFVEFIGSYDLIINPFVYKIYNLIYKLREHYLRLKKI
jgi:lipid II:glycine glycyltransferase (peptidoglycan interpeptide bridge formation enzyme)